MANSDGSIKHTSTPGNYVPGNSSTHEADDSKVDLPITPPTGEDMSYTSEENYIKYCILGVSIISMLSLGIVLIKKKILSK